MMRMLAIAALGLTTAVAAQTPATTASLVPLKKAGVEVKFGTNMAVKTLPDLTPITKSAYLSVIDRDAQSKQYNAYSRMSASIYSCTPKCYMPYHRAYVGNYGKVYGNKATGGTAKGFDQDFNFQMGDGKQKFTGTLKFYFRGYAYGGATASATFMSKTYKSDPLKPGNFSFKDEYPVKDVPIVEAINLAAAATVAKEKTGYYSAYVYVYFYPEMPTKQLAWSVPDTKANCGKGIIGTAGTVALGQRFDITLSGADDMGAVKSPMALLFYGTDIQTWWFLTLPMPLKPYGADGCELRVAIRASRTAKVENKAAKFPFYLSTYYKNRPFNPIYFQIAYMTDGNTLGLYWTKYGMLETK